MEHSASSLAFKALMALELSLMQFCSESLQAPYRMLYHKGISNVIGAPCVTLPYPWVSEQRQADVR